jgi:hypothetical protein
VTAKETVETLEKAAKHVLEIWYKPAIAAMGEEHLEQVITVRMRPLLRRIIEEELAQAMRQRAELVVEGKLELLWKERP